MTGERESLIVGRSREPDGTPSNALCVCGHEARKHVMTSQTQRCEALIYTNAPLGGGSSYPCDCWQFMALCTGFGNCACDVCDPPGQEFPLADHGKPLGFWQTIWAVVRGLRIYG